MKLRLLSGFSALLICAFVAQAHETPARGHLVLIGGGEKPAAAMAKFIELAGGKDAPIVVIPTASEDPDTPSYYMNLFQKELGSTDVVVLPIKTKEDANRPELVVAAGRARGIFFGGGDQVKILNALEGTPVLAALAEAHGKGAVIAGTSAGTACQSERMITGEGDFKVIQAGAVELRPGLGFLRGVMVDQHFVARQRENRLISVLLQYPEQLGVGVDEDTAIWVRPDDTFEVIGARSVMVFDLSGSAIQRGPAAADGKALLGVHGMRVHIVLPGEVFDIAKRAPVPASSASPRATGAR